MIAESGRGTRGDTLDDVQPFAIKCGCKICFTVEDEACVSTMSPEYFPRLLNVPVQPQPPAPRDDVLVYG